MKRKPFHIIQRFRVEGGRLEFDAAPCSESADEAVSNEGRMEARALDDAKEFLADALKDGPKPATEIFEMAKGEGLSMGTLRRARESMSVKVRRPGKGIKSIWSLNNECQPGV